MEKKNNKNINVFPDTPPRGGGATEIEPRGLPPGKTNRFRAWIMGTILEDGFNERRARGMMVGIVFDERVVCRRYIA